MGSATREALTASRAELSAIGTVDLATADELFFAARTVGESAQLRSILSDTSTDAAQKHAVLAAVFGSTLGEKSLRLLETVVGNRWSSQGELLAGIEEIGRRGDRGGALRVRNGSAFGCTARTGDREQAGRA
jgi:F-type H+-transporting ATPase subunit delta